MKTNEVMSEAARRLLNDLRAFPGYRGQAAGAAAKRELEDMGLIRLIEAGAGKDPIAVLTKKGTR